MPSVTKDDASSKAEASDETQENPLRRAARRYKRELAWADEEAILVNLTMARARRVVSAVMPRYIDSLKLGVSLSSARFNLLLTLYFAHDRRLAQNRISREMEVSRTNITNLIDGLVKDGLVTRVTSPVDRRVSYAQLTEKGEELCANLLPPMTQLMMDACENFTDEEKRTLSTLLYRYQQDLSNRYLDGETVEAP
jgi:MarR family 2-MHQ and catechol resistance regulon transcriptional repressor